MDKTVVLRACVHLEREKPAAALWLAWLLPVQVLPGIMATAETIWRACICRWPAETGRQFRK